MMNVPTPPERFSGQNDKVMKYNYTFEEVSKIFAQVAKIEVKANAVIEAQENYNKAQSEYVDGGFQLVAGAEMSKAYDIMSKARKAYHKALNDFVVVNEFSNDDYREDYIIANKQRDWSIEGMVYSVKEWAIRASQKIRF